MKTLTQESIRTGRVRVAFRQTLISATEVIERMAILQPRWSAVDVIILVVLFAAR